LGTTVTVDGLVSVAWSTMFTERFCQLVVLAAYVEEA
jgi:hypothetical protein